MTDHPGGSSDRLPQCPICNTLIAYHRLTGKAFPMPIMHGPNTTVPADDITAWGLVTFTAGMKNITELHFHDCDEYVCMVSGRMLMRSEGVLYEVGPRDVLVTRMGDEHEVVEILEDTTYFWFTGPLRGAKRQGHLHGTAG